MRDVYTTARFRKRLSLFRELHPDLADAAQATMQLVAENPRSPSLRTHGLKGDLADYFASRISRDYRVVFALEPGRVIFLDIGTHDDVYR